jgi:dephospho-CoA kinase
VAPPPDINRHQPVASRGGSAPAFIGLTGAVASGKSEALAAFARLGAATLSSDAVTHELLGASEVREQLVERWGEAVLVDGRLERARVGEIVFGRPDELAWLESVLHPLVGERIVEWRRSLPAETALAVVEVPLLFETGMEGVFDATVSVVADDSTRAARAGDRGTELLEGRSGRQLSQDEKAARATHVISNDGSLAELEDRVARLVPVLAALAPGAA